MAHYSIRAQREQSLHEQQSEFVISEVVAVMRDLDLMEIIRAKCDGDLQKVRYIIIWALLFCLTLV